MLLAILTQPQTEATLADKTKIEENTETIATVIASKDDDASAPTELNIDVEAAKTELTGAQNDWSASTKSVDGFWVCTRDNP